MPAARTEITEIATGLATLGHPDPACALAARPSELAGVDDACWERLRANWHAGRHRREFAAAWANGRAFLEAAEGLRGRPPRLVEWKGPHRDPGDEVVPADLRLDHVWLVSCKYVSRILHNAAPANLFDHLLHGAGGSAVADWYQEVAPAEYQGLYEAVRPAVAGRAGVPLPARAADLTPTHRGALRDCLAAGWPAGAVAAYQELSVAVARASTDRWRRQLATKRDRLRLLWRLLRVHSAPYFVLGASGEHTLRLRVTTPWDWRDRFDLRRFDVAAGEGRQPLVCWRAEVRDAAAGEVRPVEGHVEIRWSHGRFARPPEAKVYLDTPHHQVPGYEPLR